MHTRAYIIITLAGCLTYANAWFNAGKNDFFETNKRGWHYFEKDKDENKTDLVEQRKEIDTQDERFMSSIPINNLDLLTAEQFTQTFEKARQIAVMKPTKQNVAIVQKMNKFQTEQSEIFAKIWELNNLENPHLEFPDIVTSKVAINEEYDKKKVERDNFFTGYKDNLGFIVFVSGLNKETNEKQIQIYESIQREYPVVVEYVDTDENTDLVTTLNLKTTPENFFAYKNSKDELILKRVKAGLATKDEILNNTIFLFENAILEKDK